jgi:hypothetical protein
MLPAWWLSYVFSTMMVMIGMGGGGESPVYRNKIDYKDEWLIVECSKGRSKRKIKIPCFGPVSQE